MTAPLTKEEFGKLCARTRAWVSATCQKREGGELNVKRVPNLSYLTPAEVDSLRTVDMVPDLP